MTDRSGYDALVVVSFGGPEGPDDVLPFLQNVTRGRGVPPERLAEVAEHYRCFGGVSPINAQNRALVDALRREQGLGLPVYWGNRNWAPYLTDTVREMAADGVRRALGFVTSAYASYSACRQYQEDIAAARAAVGVDAPEILRLRHFFNHPLFIAANADGVRRALGDLPADRRDAARLVYTAHSIPTTMAETAGPEGDAYVTQLREAARLVTDAVAPGRDFDLVWQSRSGPPQVQWLEPDIGDHLRALAAAGVPAVVVSPVGFVSDHVEVRWDLDEEAREIAAGLGLRFARAATAGGDPRFVTMVRELVDERRYDAQRRAVGSMASAWDVCPLGCCPPPRRRVVEQPSAS
ncbi:MAG: ferrochelatase [Mycobacteriales bacterium]